MGAGNVGGISADSHVPTRNLVKAISSPCPTLDRQMIDSMDDWLARNADSPSIVIEHFVLQSILALL
jgi:hypothetical protein